MRPRFTTRSLVTRMLVREFAAAATRDEVEEVFKMCREAHDVTGRGLSRPSIAMLTAARRNALAWLSTEDGEAWGARCVRKRRKLRAGVKNAA
jgi:hypothetical protein